MTNNELFERIVKICKKVARPSYGFSFNFFEDCDGIFHITVKFFEYDGFIGAIKLLLEMSVEWVVNKIENEEIFIFKTKDCFLKVDF